MIGSVPKFTAMTLAASTLCLASTTVVAQTSTPTVQEINVHPPAPLNAETRHKVVSYTDLDLNSTSGQQTILRRLKAASREVCAPQPNIKVRSDYTKCYDGAMSGALADLGNTQVSAMYKK